MESIPNRNVSIGQFEVPAMGYGAMVLEGYYGEADEQQGIATIQAAANAGIRLIDTADAYGAGHNEVLVAKALQKIEQPMVVATKAGVVYDDSQPGHTVKTGWGHKLRLNSSPEYITWAVEQSLQRLDTKAIDLLYLHYTDPVTPIEETMRCLRSMVEAGKVRGVGLSNITPDELRRAHQIHPIAAMQYEYSLQNRSAEEELLPLTKELGITFVAWSPLGSGLLTGGFQHLDKTDFRALRLPDDLSYEAVHGRLQTMFEMAETIGISPAQLALAWLYHKGDNIMTIPGTRRPARIRENLASLAVTLTDEQVKILDDLSANNALGLKNLL